MRRFLYLIFTIIMPQALFAAPGNGSLEFIENKGQWDGPFSFKTETGGTTIFFGSDAFTYVVASPENLEKMHAHKGVTGPRILKYHAYRMRFEGANKTPVMRGDLPQQHYYNYYLGSEEKHWKSNIHPCMELNYQQVYKNIDIHLSSQEGNLKFDLIVKPYTDPTVIKLRYEGAEGLSIKDGKLQIRTTVGVVEELRPYAYQLINGQQVKVFCRYKLSGQTVSYSFPDGYDESKELVIDPTVVFATFTGSTADNWGYTATYDAGGNFYAGGTAFSLGYPISTGAIQGTFAGGQPMPPDNNFETDISISKFNSLGNALLYSTYLGGRANEQPHSLIVDGAGNLIVAGRTYSNNFPRTATAYDTSFNGNGDLILSKFNATGTALLGSTYVGGSGEDICNITPQEFGHGNLKHNYGDDARSEVIIDRAGNIYVAACTRSSNFPTTGTAIRNTLGSGDAQDAVILKMNSNLTALLWSTYLGGNGDDAAYVIALDNNETNIFVAGGTMSNDLPATGGAYSSSLQGNIDGFIAKFVNGGGYGHIRTTYIGRGGYDQCYGLQVDPANNVWAMGQTMGGTFPVSAGVYSNPGSSQFVIKMNDQLSTNLLSTVFGSGNSSATNISPVAFLIDTCGNIYISGWGGNLYPTDPPPGTGNTFGMPVGGLAGPAAQSTTDGEDFYFIVLSQNMSSLMYGTFMGTSGGVGEHVDGGTSRFDKNGTIYQAICGGCGRGTFPTTAGSYSTTNKGPNCNLVALKIAFFLGPVRADFRVSPDGFACLGTPFTFTNVSANATSYEWDMGNGTTFTSVTPPSYTYASIGTYVIRLIAKNPLSCNLADTLKITVKVDSNTIKAGMETTIIDTCAPFTTAFKNTSRASKTPAGTVYKWDFGDGTTFTGQNPPNKNYPAAGTYTIKLYMTDPTACNSPDSVATTVTFRDDNVKAIFEVPDLICLGDSFAPSNTSIKALTFLWKFGDKGTSTLERPFHRYDTAGTYKVTLYAYNPTTCNKVDSLSKMIFVEESPTADFSYSPVEPITNEITVFTNLSKNAVLYNWNFGDGDGSQEVHPQHFFKRTGTYKVCLVASNKQGCSDTVCKNVSADVQPLADIPNAFSPNGDGNNDMLFVFGAAVERINLKIYNRWGQLVFESNDIKNGWDGKFNGKPQEMDAYAYVLNASFIDGTSLNKKGNVTLLR